MFYTHSQVKKDQSNMKEVVNLNVKIFLVNYKKLSPKKEVELTR